MGEQSTHPFTQVEDSRKGYEVFVFEALGHQAKLTVCKPEKRSLLSLHDQNGRYVKQWQPGVKEFPCILTVDAAMKIFAIAEGNLERGRKLGVEAMQRRFRSLLGLSS